MKIFARLKFREISPYTDKNGDTKYRVRFLDDDDRRILLFMSEQSAEPYQNLEENDIVDVPMTLYETRKNPRYNIWCE